MPEFATRTLAVIDDTHDRERASDGRSRLGVYLAQHAQDLRDGDKPLTATEFATAVWRIATSPVMSPGYIRVRPDLRSLRPAFSDDGDLVLHIEVPLRHHHLAQRPRGLDDWHQLTNPWADDNRWPVLVHADTIDRPALFVSASLAIPIPDDLLSEPGTHKPGPIMTMEAKNNLAALVSFANSHAHLVNDLLARGTR
ncbi:hypothetical protein BX265_0861 [Streptomyces sp. TLI_235]|nr:hypothetical protein [Streptomyces sp. TLI_235]PBC76158.1 hypothetical protein BX265_0861 [Streptomyces sp. TLI_235]